MALCPSLFRPRRWRTDQVLPTLLVLYLLVCFLFDMPLFSSKLPQYSGDYDVGVIDIEAPVEKRKISSAVFKDTGLPAFELETVLFSLYYPSVPSNQGARKKPHHLWVERPLALTGEGYARFAKINNFVTNNLFTFGLWMLAGSTTIPADPDVPIHGTTRFYRDYEMEQPLDDYGLPSFPVIVFSHGMASSRTSYTQWCGELASRGFVVAAIEHRDGSGPGTIVMNKTDSHPRFHINPNLLDPVPEVADFKVMQLAMRQAEVEETVRVLRMISIGRGGEVYKNNPRMEGQHLHQFKARLNMERVIMGGHSFGATATLQVLKDAPSEKFPFIGAIAMDPGKQSGPLNDEINVPVVIVHSQSWSAKHTIFHGRPHFSVVKDLVRKIINEKRKHAWFTTAKGTTHPSVTDAPLIEPHLLAWTTGSKIDAREGVLQYVQITRQLIHYLETGNRESILKEDITHPEYDKDVREGNPQVSNYWQIHMAPPSAECRTLGKCDFDDKDMDHD